MPRNPRHDPSKSIFSIGRLAPSYATADERRAAIDRLLAQVELRIEGVAGVSIGRWIGPAWVVRRTFVSPDLIAVALAHRPTKIDPIRLIETMYAAVDPEVLVRTLAERAIAVVGAVAESETAGALVGRPDDRRVVRLGAGRAWLANGEELRFGQSSGYARWAWFGDGAEHRVWFA